MTLDTSKLYRKTVRNVNLNFKTFSFAIGGDGQIYEGRGFNVIGAHAPKYNYRSVGICLIGDWSSTTRKSVRYFSVVKIL